MGCRHTFLGRPYKEKDVETFFVSRWRKYQDISLKRIGLDIR